MKSVKMEEHTPVILNGVCKLLAKTSAASWVRCHNDVSLVREDFRIPPGTPGVWRGSLRSAVDVEEKRVGFALVKIRRIHKPGLDLNCVNTN